MIDRDKARGIAASLRAAFRDVTDPDRAMNSSIKKLDVVDRVGKAFAEEQKQRDKEHDEHVKRLLGHMDAFIKGGEDERPAT